MNNRILNKAIMLAEVYAFLSKFYGIVIRPGDDVLSLSDTAITWIYNVYRVWHGDDCMSEAIHNIECAIQSEVETAQYFLWK